MRPSPIGKDLFDHPLFEFGLPLEPWALVTLALAVVCGGLALGAKKKLFTLPGPMAPSRPPRLVRYGLLGGLALGASLTSWLYFRDFLRGGPRIIDATAYLLEARIFANGAFTFHPPAPSDLFLGRFLLRTADSPADIGVIFPPGYPAILAWFAKFDAPYLLGPLLAFGIVLTTYQLTLRLAEAEQESQPGHIPRAGDASLRSCAPFLAATLSALSITLRYHTSEPMSHGLSTWLTACLFWLGLGGLERVPLFRSGLFGLGAGLLFATRPLTALAVFVGLLALGRKRLGSLGLSNESNGARPAALLLGALPGLLLYVCYQKALTGNYFGSAQLNYYLASDGPHQCFGLGFGKGCAFEHGDVLEQRGPLGPLWAILNSLHRLHQHSLDIANFEPIALGLAYLLWRQRSTLKSRLTFATLGALVFLYAFFYFDGSYPGGGARFLVEVLPLEHACLALLATSHAASPSRSPSASLGGSLSASLGLTALSLFGFSTHGIFSHLSLRERDGGAPFLSDTVALAPEKRIVFVKSDHAFLSGFDPRALGDDGKLRRTLVARQSHDAREALLVKALGAPAFRTLHEPATPREPERISEALRDGSAVSNLPATFEAERAWPPLALRGAWGHPVHHPEACLSGGSGLALWFDSARPGPAALDIWLDVAPSRSIRLFFWSGARGCFSILMPAPPIPTRFSIPLAEWIRSSPRTHDWTLGDEPSLIFDRWEFASD